MEGFSFVMPVTGLKTPNNRKEDDNDCWQEACKNCSNCYAFNFTSYGRENACMTNCTVFVKWGKCLILLLSACAPEMPPSSTEKKESHILVNMPCFTYTYGHFRK
jgi:hypothetical protein